MVNTDLMYRTSQMCMDILVGKLGFPDFAFVLHEEGWLTHHVVLERIKSARGVGTRRVNTKPSQPPVDFGRTYVDMVFAYMSDRKKEEGRDYNIEELAFIPFGERRDEVLALGDVVSREELPGEVVLETINYSHQGAGKTIKVYSPPKAVLVEHDSAK